MDFNKYAYERPDLEKYQADFKVLFEEFEQAETASQQIAIVHKANELRRQLDTMLMLCSIRHSVDTTDEFYKTENDFFDNNYPKTNATTNQYYRLLLNSKFRSELEKTFGNQLFSIAEMQLKTFRPEILEDLVKENKLSTEYRKIKAQAKLEFRGKTYNLSTISPFEIDADRATRKEASTAKWSFFKEKAAEIERIYDELVKVRHSMAQKLGFKNYIELGYARMQRFDYNAEMTANFRKQIQEHIVPIATEIFERQRKRLGLDELKSYDEGFEFPTGNPTPKGGGEWMEAQASKMYKELSPETDEFFSFMSDRNLMDLVAKDGKETGGYCTFIPDYQSPYIFSNFNGTSHDVVVLTHEAGHAFQCYATSRNHDLYEYLWPTYEACEIHSMSMEFFTWPWMDLFFKEDVEKFKYSHLAKSITFLPYGCAVDEFQHVVYENPEMTPAERNAAWKAIEKKYLPHRDYDGLPLVEEGGFWQRQSHIFSSPFYYIDYVLAQTCAFQFWKRSQEDKEEAWKDYINLCKAGGTASFLKLVDLANLRSPFEDGTIASVIEPIQDFLNAVDDSQF